MSDAEPGDPSRGDPSQLELAAAREEIARLRRELAELQTAELHTSVLQAGGPQQARRRRTANGAQRWRAFVACLLIVIGVVLVPVSVSAYWARNKVLDTGNYVATVSPLASDPTIQRAIADRATTAMFDGLERTLSSQYGVTLDQVSTNLISGLLDQTDLGPKIKALVASKGPYLVDQLQNEIHSLVLQFVQSDQFQTLWDNANRDAHNVVVKVLTGKGNTVTVDENTGVVSIHLGPIITQVRGELVAKGVPLADAIPTNLNPSFTLFQSDSLAKARGYTRMLDQAGTWLPILALAFLVAGVALARGHRRALVGVGVGVAIASAVVLLGFWIGRPIYLDAIPPEVMKPEVAGVVYDTVLRFLIRGMQMFLALGVAVAAAGVLAGPARLAVAIRSGFVGAARWLRAAFDRSRIPLGPVPAFVAANTFWLRALSVGVVALVWVLVAQTATVGTVAWLALLVVVLFAIIEFLAAPPSLPARANKEASTA